MANDQKIAMAKGLSLEELTSFLKLFSRLESYDCTEITTLKKAMKDSWTITLNDEKDIGELLRASLKDGILASKGWANRFRFLDNILIG